VPESIPESIKLGDSPSKNVNKILSDHTSQREIISYARSSYNEGFDVALQERIRSSLQSKEITSTVADIKARAAEEARTPGDEMRAKEKDAGEVIQGERGEPSTQMYA
jgi:hypothetical protein